MTLLIDIRDPDWMTDEALKEQLAPLLPDVEILCGDPGARADAVTMVAAISLFPNSVDRLPNLQVVQKLGAGVDGILRQPLPEHVRVCRLRPDIAALEIAEYCLAYVLQRQRNVREYADSQRAGQWQPLEPEKAADITVAVLGLGHIGGRIARCFSALSYRVIGWSRHPKEISGVESLIGDQGLVEALAAADYVISILPSTPETRGLFGATRLGCMKKGATLINVGRGDLIDEDALIAALDQGRPGAAILDVVSREPLPGDSPLWSHPSVTLTPHVSGWHIDGGLEDIAANYHRLTAGEPLLHEVDRRSGY